MAIEAGQAERAQDDRPLDDHLASGEPPPVGPLAPPTPPHPAKPSLRHRVLPRTVLGLASLILAASVGAAFSGAVLYSYYEYRLQKTNDKVNNLVSTYKKQFDNARGDLAAQEAQAKADISAQLGPVRQLQASSEAVQALIKKVAPSMFFVHTLDTGGQASVGSAFAVVSNPRRTLLLTSYTTIQAATKQPSPQVFVRQGGADTRVTVWTWDEKNDLALIILPRGNVPTLSSAPATPPPVAGDRVYAASGLGSLGASLSPGAITDVSAAGLQHNAPVGQAFQGGPLLNSTGDVLGVLSRTYSPLNFTSDAVWFSPYLGAACDRVLQCPGGNFSNATSGQQS